MGDDGGTIETARIGGAAPEFTLLCVTATDASPRPVRPADFAGRWLMLIFYPRDFTFVCPTELTAFSARMADFQHRDCDLLGISVDSIELHQEWLATPSDKGGLGPLQFPLVSDGDGVAARAYGVWVEEKRVSTRGLFVIDPAGIVQYAVLHNLSVGRSPDEVLRVLDALQTGGLCPASWTSADGTIDPESALQPGSILGHYRIRKRLGKGTFGTVFATWDMRLERMVALKVLKQKVFESREAVLTESRAAAKLNHPHVCTVYSVEEQDGLPMIVMEYLDGHPLSQAISDGLEEADAVRFAAQVADGLAAAHQQGVVHGDLKPANIMLTNDGAAKVLDFGLARSQRTVDPRLADAKADAAEGAAREGVGDNEPANAGVTDDVAPVDTDEASAEATFIRGTPAYMSPEQATGLRPTPTSDVFSLGILLFEMLTGRRAHSDESPVALIVKLRIRDLAADLVPQVDEMYRDLLAAMLARDPAARPAMSEVARRLAGIGASQTLPKD